MNDYKKAMTHCELPADLEHRLASRVLNTEPKERRVIRPMTLVRKAVLAAALILLLSASVGAAVWVNWDEIFAGRFGQEAASLPVTQTAFQQVGVISVCDDVTLTVREALGDSNTIYLILDYQLNDPSAQELAQLYWDSDSAEQRMASVEYFATGNWDWEALKTAEAELWAKRDWTAQKDRSAYLWEENVLVPEQFLGNGSRMQGEQSYHPETGTLTYLLRFSTDSSRETLQDQPLTLLVLPPVAVVEGKRVPLADHPALITFQPEYTATVRRGAVREENGSYRADAGVSPFTITVNYCGGEYRDLKELSEALRLVLKDGTVIPVQALGEGYSGSCSYSEAVGKAELYFRTHFQEILAVDSVEAVEIGTVRIPLS